MPNITSSDETINIADLITEVEEYDSLLEDYTTSIAEHEDSIDELLGENEETEDDIKNLDSVTDADEIERLYNNIDANKNSIDDINTNIATIREDITDLNDDFEDLQEFADTVANYSTEGTLIHKDHFETYIRDMIEEEETTLSQIVVIDWEATADMHLVDYTTYEFEGVSYYSR